MLIEAETHNSQGTEMREQARQTQFRQYFNKNNCVIFQEFIVKQLQLQHNQ